MSNVEGIVQVSILDRLIDESDVQDMFRILLRRDPQQDVGYRDFIQNLISQKTNLGTLISIIRNSEELRRQVNLEGKKEYSANRADNFTFRIPQDLQIKEDSIKKVLFVGSCLMNSWVGELSYLNQGVVFEHIIFNNASTLPNIEKEVTYDFQILQIPLRSVIKEAQYFELNYGDAEGYERIFSEALAALRINLERITRYAREHALRSFVLNFCVPQQNFMGRLLDRYSLSNPVYFVEQLNIEFYKMVREIEGCYFIEFNEIVNTFGKKYFQDDSTTHWNHASLLGGGFGFDEDLERLESVGDVDETYAPDFTKYIEAIYQECVSAYRTIQQIDSIKIVFFDLDDTLWRGVAAEKSEFGEEFVEGWPISILESASYLWKRGVLVAIVSKNDEARVVDIWNKCHGNMFSIDNFVARKINWKPKSENIKEILDSVNLSPHNALFVDDNPVERSAVLEALPGIRVLETPLINWRRVLLWAPELQRSEITKEAQGRTSMVKAQILRDEGRAQLSNEDFLRNLNVQVKLGTLRSLSDSAYPRCFELINKTNQFNTTGRRWTDQDFRSFFDEGGELHYASVSDRYTNYGIVAILVVRRQEIEQYVMSCRVFGMEVEKYIAIHHCKMAMADGSGIAANFLSTERNSICKDFYRDLGFSLRGDGKWFLENQDIADLEFPSHIAMLA